jgi:hypothetical protein
LLTDLGIDCVLYRGSTVGECGADTRSIWLSRASICTKAWYCYLILLLTLINIYPTLFNGNRSWSLIKEKFIKRNEIIKGKNIISSTGKLSKEKIPSLQFKVEVSSTSSYLCISENATLWKSSEWSEHYTERKLQGYDLKLKSVVPVHIDACLKVQPFGKIMNELSIT